MALRLRSGEHRKLKSKSKSNLNLNLKLKLKLKLKLNLNLNFLLIVNYLLKIFTIEIDPSTGSPFGRLTIWNKESI